MNISAEELSKYSKQELIYIIMNAEYIVMFGRSIDRIILEKKLEDVSKEISENLIERSELSKQIDNETNLEKKWQLLLEYSKLSAKWERLYKKQEKIMNELYPQKEGD